MASFGFGFWFARNALMKEEGASGYTVGTHDIDNISLYSCKTIAEVKHSRSK